MATSTGGLTLASAQGFEHLGDAGLVVGAQDGVARGADHAVHQFRPDALAGLDRVGMAGKEDRLLAFAVFGRQLGHQVAVGVLSGVRPQFLEFRQEIIDEAGFVARFAVDPTISMNCLIIRSDMFSPRR